MFRPAYVQYLTLNIYSYAIAVYGLSCDYLKWKGAGSNEDENKECCQLLYT
jgi:hypothetical protein